MKILIAADGTPDADQAVRLGAEIGRITGAALTVLSVSKEVGPAVEAARAIAEGAAHDLRTLPGLVESQVRVGHPAEEILLEAEEGQYNLIIVGERERHLLSRFFLGSTAERVVEHAPCPVLVARGSRASIGRILLCDSGMAKPPLLERLTAQLGDLIAGQQAITLLHVMSQMSAGPGVPGAALRADAQTLIEAASPEGELLERDVAILDTWDAHAEPLVRHGRVVDEIVEEAATGDYDLLVIGGHQAEGWRRLLLDDLARQILAQVDLPVLVVR